MLSNQVDYSGQNPVFQPPDRIDLTNSHSFKDTLEEVYQKGFKTLLLDFTHLYFIDSAGLAQLIVYYKKFNDRGGELKIINLKNDYIKRLFSRIDLHTVINIEGLSEEC